jgi:hypothetical protein
MHGAMWARLVGAGLIAGCLALVALPTMAADSLSAIVESISPPREDIRSFDLLAQGTVIELKAGETLVLGYMQSCTHEEISGGRVTVGDTQSKVDGGAVKRSVVPCDGSIDPDSAAGSNEAAVVAIRGLGSASASGVRVVPSVQPVFVLPGGAAPADPSLTIQRLDRQESPIRVSLFGRTLDLRQTGMKLTPGGLYSAICGDHKVAFKIADNAGVDQVVTLQRVVRF